MRLHVVRPLRYHSFILHLRAESEKDEDGDVILMFALQHNESADHLQEYERALRDNYREFG